MKKLTLILLTLILTSLSSSCDNESVGKSGYEDAEIINYNSNLFSLIQRVANNTENNSRNSIECIKFSYPLLLYIYNNNQEYLESRYLENAEALYNALTYVENNEYQIGINYPLFSIDNDGNTIEIDNNVELQKAIQICANEELVKECNNFCSGITDLFDKCYWKITSFNNQEDYIDNLLYMDESGALKYFHNNIKYEGSWLAHIDGNDNQLFLNLFIESDGEMDFINKDWKVLSDFNDCCELKITDDNITIIMEKKCIKSCNSSTFTVCNPENQEEININLNEYLPCLADINPFSEVNPVEFNFYETLSEAAEEEADSISLVNYIMLSNPQTIYLKTKALYSTSDFQVSEIILEGLDFCD